MFTGIVQRMGKVSRLLRRGGGALIEVESPDVASRLSIGDSVAVNGACVTVTARTDRSFQADLVPETMARTTLGTLATNEEVNLELPLRAGDRLDGHLVQGHVDVVGMVRSRRRVGAQEVLEVNVPFEITRYLAPKGSVALDGVSLTVVDVGRDRFRVALIPHTVAVTTLGQKVQGSTLNVEIDVLSKYVERHLAARAAARSMGFSESLGTLHEAATNGPPPAPEAQHTPVALQRAAAARAAKPAPKTAARPGAKKAAAKPAGAAKAAKKVTRAKSKAVAARSRSAKTAAPRPRRASTTAARKPAGRSAGARRR